MYLRALKSLLILALIFLSNRAVAAGKFTSTYPCEDGVKTCVSSGARTIDGETVYRDCWEFTYSKTCNYPGKDDCKDYSHCYAVADLPCLLQDCYGNCVNLQKEFSCKSWEPVTIDKEMVRTGLVEKEGKDKLVCKGVPCIDGNCVDKSYMTDDDMMDSVSKLYAVSQMKGALDLNFKLFAGFAQSCSKKATSYTNCCSTSLKGWGKDLGAKCKQDEVDLIDKRQKNLCVYVGKENKQTMGITAVVKHHYCCFGSLLNKVIQVEGRKQLGINFGSGKNTDCRGLTLAEIMRLDFDKMDFSEFFIDILKRMKIPKIGDISSRVNSSLPNIRKYDGNPNNKKNNMTGWNLDVKDDSWEAEEEKRLEAERIERERQLALERERQRLLEEERQRKLAVVKTIPDGFAPIGYIPIYYPSNTKTFFVDNYGNKITQLAYGRAQVQLAIPSVDPIYFWYYIQNPISGLWEIYLPYTGSKGGLVYWLSKGKFVGDYTKISEEIIPWNQIATYGLIPVNDKTGQISYINPPFSNFKYP